MTTVDNRYQEGVVGEEPAPHARSTARREETHDDTSTYEEHSLAVGVEADGCEAPSEEERFKLGRSKLAGALTELLEALRSRYLTVQAVRAFLAPGQTK
ncbi:hypothetical protein GSI_13778 [Ganoderma sinense ZZ0214-1]|uniref:Uncharacterized protein n=1 Tax=Ganoderma sinense ZZ0214-1 TaxID=1077348 RepID=A0A2G8RR92_9APHY|nr:hypothetical protein GSI_13778 [Ganoderma sinense ZZ0214-1]